MKQAQERYVIYQTNTVLSQEGDTVKAYNETHLYNGRLYKTEEQALALCDNLRCEGVDGLFAAKVMC